MPTSGCDFSSSAISANTPMASILPGNRGYRRPSLISHAATMVKHGFRNSDGCTDMPGNAIQRRAPLISTPITIVAAVSTNAIRQPTMATRRMLRGDSSDTPTTIAPAAARNTTCFRMNMSREVPIRSATAGLAASIMM